MTIKVARWSPPFYWWMGAFMFFALGAIVAVTQHEIDGKVWAAVLFGLLMVVLALGKRQH